MDFNNNTSACCPICGNKISFRFSVPCDYRKPTYHKKYEIYWCQECDYGLVWGRPSKAEVAEFYVLENYYTHHAKSTDVNDGDVSLFDRIRTHISWRFDAGEDLTPHEALLLLKEKYALTICEIGCGNGDNISKFHSKGFSVFGVEPDPVAREVAKQVTINIFDGTAEEIPEAITNNKYDVVLMSHVLEHCLDINAAVSNARDILSNGGVYIVETPNCGSAGFRTYQGEWPWSDIPRHLNFFTPASLNKLLKKYGFQVKFIKYRGYCRQFSNSWLKNEEEVWSAFSKYDMENKVRPNFRARAWKLLLRTAFAPKSAKYDSVRLIAFKM